MSKRAFFMVNSSQNKVVEQQIMKNMNHTSTNKLPNKDVEHGLMTSALNNRTRLSSVPSNDEVCTQWLQNIIKTSHTTTSASIKKNIAGPSHTVTDNIKDMEITIDTTLRPLKLFKPTDEPNSCPIVIEIPFHSDLAITPYTDQILDLDSFLPPIESVSDGSINYSDPEYVDPIKEIAGGRKRNISNKRKQKQIEKNTLPYDYLISCDHVTISEKANPYSICSISLLSHEDIMTFKKNLCSLTSKIDQDKFVLTMMKVEKAKRTHHKKTTRTDRVTTKYFIPNLNGDMLRVCAQAFSSITSITRRRLNIISKNFNEYHKSPKENRGGKHLNASEAEVTLSIENHIKSFKCRKSHYTRRETGRSYLQPGLSIKAMWSHWKMKRLKEHSCVASLSKYQFIFTSKFNLSFGHPRQDICSFCTQQSTKIKIENNENVKNELQLELQLHQRRAKRFFELLKEESPDSISVSFDMMQTQPLPKLSVTEVFYSRQVWLYNLTFVIAAPTQGPENCFLYTWTECESGRGPNEVCSSLIDFLENLEVQLKFKKSPPTTLNLFSDSCSGQNKNQFTMVTLLYYINYKTTVFKKINHIFPVRGHSYMPPDRVFGRIEQVLKKKESIVSPSQYHAIFKRFCTVKVYEQDFIMYDYKSVIKKLVKTKSDFKSTEQKIYTYTKGEKTVGVSKTYGGIPTKIEVIKRNSSLSTLYDNLVQLPKTNHIKIPKQNDVRKLLNFFSIPEDSTQFYEDIFSKSNEIENEELVDEYDEDEH